MTNWSNERELEFLELYQSEPILWDPKHSYHKDRNKIHDAWRRISEVLNVPVAELRKKKDSLMATFRMHRRKIKASEDSGSGADDIYKPIWFAFDFMNSFLGEGLVCKTTRNTATESQERTDYELEKEHDREMDHTSRNSVDLPESIRAQTLPSIRRRRDPPELLEAGRTMNKALTTLNEVILQQGDKRDQQDECDLYGKMLAKKLRKLPDIERLKFMHEIDGMFIHHLSSNTPAFVVSPSPSPTAHYVQLESTPSSHSESIPMGHQYLNLSLGSYSEPTTAQQVHREVVQSANNNFPLYAAHISNTPSQEFMPPESRDLDEPESYVIRKAFEHS